MDKPDVFDELMDGIERLSEIVAENSAKIAKGARDPALIEQTEEAQAVLAKYVHTLHDCAIAAGANCPDDCPYHETRH